MGVNAEIPGVVLARVSVVERVTFRVGAGSVVVRFARVWVIMDMFTIDALTKRSQSDCLTPAHCPCI